MTYFIAVRGGPRFQNIRFVVGLASVRLSIWRILNVTHQGAARDEDGHVTFSRHVCMCYRRFFCAMPVTVSRSCARRTRTATSACRRGRSASTAAIRSAFEQECTDEVYQPTCFSR